MSFPLYERLDAAGRMLLTIGGETAKDLLNWLIAHVNENEKIVVDQWTGNWWYIEIVVVKDNKRISICAFTFNVTDDRYIWNNSHEDNPSGGNCFQRSHRWRRLILKKFPLISTDEMSDYRKSSGVLQSQI